MIIHPDSFFIKVAPYVCGCDLSSKYDLCELLLEYTLKTGLLNKVSLHHQYQEYFKDNEIQESLEIGDLGSNDQIVAIAAENSSINTVWFVYVIKVKCVDHSSSNIDGYIILYNIPKSQPYLLRNYLKKVNDNKKGVVYQRSKKNVFLYKGSIVYPFAEFEPNYNQKEYLLFLSNNRFIEVLNCVKFTAVGSLF